MRSRWRRWGLVLVVAAGPVAATGAPWAGGALGPGEDLEEMARGQRLYAQSCASCHGPTGGGTAQGPPLIGVGGAAVDFMLSTGRMPMAEPGQQPTRGEPAFSPEETRALVAYVSALGPGGPEIPMVDPGSGDLRRGREVFTATCLACHGAGGQGASVGGGRVAPPLFGSTPLQLAEAVRVGPGTMPPFSEETIPGRDLDSLVRYVAYLESLGGRGGHELGRVGPVMEGFVAWLLGVGLLVLAVRWIGTREPGGGA